MLDWRIRAGRDFDWPQLQVLAEGAVEEAISREGSMTLRRPGMPLPEDLWPPRSGYVAFRPVDGGLVGFVAVQFFEPTPHHSGRHADISLIVVAAEARGQGIGTALLQYAVEGAKRWGAATVKLDVDEGNLAARKLYERAGFATISRLMGLQLLEPQQEPRTR
ncbi:GNAT family N-acetyltransferase [Roseomonas sp. BN140053]|uniref:GNAT family N-acetyltransferase n=1 Tax=Roseomonas sp. BN140053 TaxID=3391898 RepID=UPI0039EB0C6A